jgi:[acyl-carrier-protein] S-malonyltransferase
MMGAYGDAPVVRATFDEASGVLGRDLWALASEGPAEAQNQTVNTQPLMLTAGLAVWRLWRERGGADPELMAGHSLGEYTALVAADALDFTEALRLVELRAEAMQAAVPSGHGAMAAILGLDDEEIRSACAESAQGETVEPVNFNAPSQTVIAGHAGAVRRATEAAKARGAKRAILLPVSAPFHCTLMRPAAIRLEQALREVRLRRPAIPVISNADVACHEDPERIADALVRQAYSPVRWTDTIRFMAGRGVTRILECGPGEVLAPLVKRIERGCAGWAIADAAAIEKYLRELGHPRPRAGGMGHHAG